MTIAGVGGPVVGRPEPGDPWSAAIDLVGSALARMGHDPEGAEAILAERGLVLSGSDDASASASASAGVDGDADVDIQQVSANGSCRLLRSTDGWIAVNLPRPDDLELLPAWLGPEAFTGDSADDVVPWGAIAEIVRERPGVESVERAQELGLAVSLVPAEARSHVDAQLLARRTVDAGVPFVRTHVGAPVAVREPHDLRVVDLSSLWAGPLCTRLLADAGAHVIKVESTTRPDGARIGDPALFARLHAGKEFAEVPFAPGPEGAALRELLASADVIIEGSRPRALDRLGIDPAAVVAARPGTVWLSITAYGRTGPWRDRVGFGDDAAAAAGLLHRRPDGEPAFIGDAIADPLTGAVAAALVVDAVRSGGGVQLDVALREVARSAALGVQVQW